MLPIAIAASLVLAISISTMALSIMYANQGRARRAESEQRRVAEVNQANSQQVTRFIQRRLAGIDPAVAGDLDKTLTNSPATRRAGRHHRSR